MNVAKEHIEECLAKTEKLNILSIVVNNLSAPKLKKEAQCTIVADAMGYFPYFQHFVIPRDIKLAVQCITEVIKHRQTKSLKYQQDYTKYNCLLAQAEIKYAEYDATLSSILPPS